MHRTLNLLLALCLPLAACGGPPLTQTHVARGDEDFEEEDDPGDDQEEDDGDDGSTGFVDATLLHDVSPLELGDPVEVPGTGVTL